MKFIIDAIKRGYSELLLNTKYLFLVLLLIIFPLLFVYVSSAVFSTAQQNIVTVQKQSIATTHTAIESLLQAGSISNELLESLKNNDSSITEISLVKTNDDNLIVTHSTNDAKVNLIEGNKELFYSAAATPERTIIFDFSTDTARVWQAFRQVAAGDETYYVFTEHNYANSDTVLVKRQQSTYLLLSFIFLFLLLVAYWLAKQTNWYGKYAQLNTRFEQQVLLTSTVAHELRAPITAIKGYMSLLHESTSISTTERNYLNTVSNAANQLLVLINDFLELTRIQAGQLTINYKNTELTELLREVAEMFSAEALEKDLKINVRTPNSPTFLQTDRVRLIQVLRNLLSNAIKYTDKGSISITLTTTRTETTFTVSDTGYGIKAEDQRKLFAPFVRVGDSKSNSIKGSGLGMWITKQLVELLKGDIALESLEGVGTKVKVTFKH